MNEQFRFAPSAPIPPLEEIGLGINGPVEEGPPDIIPGFLPRDGQLVLAGETNCGKSLVALETISALITGTPLWGALKPTLAAKRVLYILGEHHAGVIQRLAIHTKLQFSQHTYLVGPEQLGFDKWLIANGKPNMLAIDKFKRWAEGVDIIVWDPLGAFCTGVDTENDNIQMRLVLEMMGLISQEAGASCLVLAHQGKPMMDKFGEEHHRKSYAIRGASAIEDAATNIFYMGRATGTGSTPMSFEMSCRKYKGISPPGYNLLRDPATLTHRLTASKDEAVDQLRKIETNAKINRLQAFNQDFSWRTAVKLVAAIEDKSEETIKRWIA